METKEVINGLRIEIENLSRRLDELEKQLALQETGPEPVAEPVEEPAVEPVAKPVTEPEPLDLDIDIDGTDKESMPDLHSFQWMNDLPGSPVANMISGISLNDRVLFINTLFREDPGLFQNTIGALNGMQSMEEAVPYLASRFPEWNFNSEVVYRFMMAARRKLK